MKILELNAKNFRTLHDFSVKFEGNYVTISGKNNCGKTSIFKIIHHFLLKEREEFLFSGSQNRIEFDRDFTRWFDGQDQCIEVSIEILISEREDSELYFAIKAFAGDEVDAQDSVNVKFSHQIVLDRVNTIKCEINGAAVSDQRASEILKKIRNSGALVYHNSVDPARRFMFARQGVLEVVESQFSQSDREKIVKAQTTLQNRVKTATKQHKGEIDKLLGKLQDKYQVELSTVERGQSSTYTLEVRLLDKSVDVPLSDWGAGTQNRTRLLMTVLEAIRKKGHSNPEDRIAPVILVEEPESFLHPSAQSDFGQVLSALASEHDMQIIATTHSPYMLNTSNPAANILLDRRTFRNALKETVQVDVAGEKWMMPFSEILGVIPSEFDGWSQIFGAKSTSVVLVEGAIVVEYFKYFKENYPSIYQLDDAIEVLPYNGKDALKNTPILRFLLSKMEKVFITFDLDAQRDVKSKLESIGLVSDTNFCAIGINEAGARCIEGLLPKSIKQATYAANPSLVDGLTSDNSDEKRNAKDQMKKALLQATKDSDSSEKDFAEFKKLFGAIKRGLA